MREGMRKNEDRKRPCSIHIFMVFINLNVGGHLSELSFVYVLVSADRGFQLLPFTLTFCV